MSSGFVDNLVMLMVMMMNQLLRDCHVNLDNLSSLGTSLISFSAVCIHDTASPDSKTALIIFVRKLRTSRTLSRHPTVFISIFNRSTIFSDTSTNVFSELLSQNTSTSTQLVTASHQNSRKYLLKSVTSELVLTNMSSGFVDNLVMLMVMMMNQLLRDRHVNLDNLSSLGTSLISFSAVCIHDTASPDSKTALIISCAS
ncbi:hypothetical protein Smp_185900 [Schistosoma mansoni]|uniref:hypothetical protein n=1 Tax=Schistosoma mansoni TaxID=6183 RepID=UPI00022C872B|nr:hypothetical protein Smp_185900 [Schistosoma mansoni]|eukprot:XP_018644557.1 hypothetical protein Smp_185900 [Schistosoma mansoni]